MESNTHNKKSFNLGTCLAGVVLQMVSAWRRSSNVEGISLSILLTQSLCLSLPLCLSLFSSSHFRKFSVRGLPQVLLPSTGQHRPLGAYWLVLAGLTWSEPPGWSPVIYRSVASPSWNCLWALKARIKWPLYWPCIGAHYVSFQLVLIHKYRSL